MSGDGWCDIHEFELTEGYPCYVCRWVEAERDRIISILNDYLNDRTLEKTTAGMWQKQEEREGLERAIMLIESMNATVLAASTLPIQHSETNTQSDSIQASSQKGTDNGTYVTQG